MHQSGHHRSVLAVRAASRSGEPTPVPPAPPALTSLSTGSDHCPTIVYENHSTLVTDLACHMYQFAVRTEIEIFDLSHLHGAARLVEAGLIDGRP
ncbi:3-keto-5-aminohexanoate cleavage protein, partial [Methylobacterium sp. J-068]|uniref:3-keto-5-aminohexanoate cleavage protein n=1 Tax=Methylobacterium sp. J-068 TaxID=2836649 RepID=UPI00391CA6E2